MSAPWMAQALLAGALLGTGAWSAERVAGWFGWPRRGIWAATMLGSLLLVSLSLWAPGLLPDPGILPDSPAAIGSLDDWRLVASGGARAGSAPAAGAGTGGLAIDLASVLAAAWLLASSSLLAAIALTCRRLRALRDASGPVVVDGVSVRLTDRMGPAVVGLLRPEVVLPRWALDLPAEERRLIVLHEREHISAGDGWLLFLGGLAVAALPWCLPLWWQHRRLRLAVETDCDARVLARGASRPLYGKVLLRAAASLPAWSLLSPAWGESTTLLERRIMSMTAKRPTHRLLRALPLLAISAGVVATACDVAGDGDSGAGARMATAPSATEAPLDDSATTVRRGPDGSVCTSTRRPDGSGVIRCTPPDDPTRGILGLRWGVTGPIRIVPGEPFPTRTPNHAEVRGVVAGSSAERAGVREGDLILSVNGRDGREAGLFRDRTPGTEYALLVRRGEEEREISFRVDPPETGRAER